LHQKLASKLEPNLFNAFFACLNCFFPERAFVDQVGEFSEGVGHFSEEVGQFSEEVGQFSEEVGQFSEEVGSVLNRSDLLTIERVCKQRRRAEFHTKVELDEGNVSSGKG
jgi:hypothetical protein